MKTHPFVIALALMLGGAARAEQTCNKAGVMSGPLTPDGLSLADDEKRIHYEEGIMCVTPSQAGLVFTITVDSKDGGLPVSASSPNLKPVSNDDGLVATSPMSQLGMTYRLTISMKKKTWIGCVLNALRMQGFCTVAKYVVPQ